MPGSNIASQRWKSRDGSGPGRYLPALGLPLEGWQSFQVGGWRLGTNTQVQPFSMSKSHELMDILGWRSWIPFIRGGT